MPVHRYRFVVAASVAGLALLAVGARTALAQQPLPPSQQVVLSNIQGLDFGRFVAGSGGTITLSPTGVRSRTGGVILLNSPNTGQAAFNASHSTPNAGRSSLGAATQAVVVSVPDNSATRLTSGANSMTVSNFVNTPDTLLLIPNNGTTLSVGATLVVAPNQAPGTYSGSFPLIVNYQ